MEPTLSIVLPVKNAAATLPEQIDRIMETLADLTPHFEVLVVDDGSDDETDEVAADLRRRFRRLRVLRHATSQGLETASSTGLINSRGDVVFIQDTDGPISASELRKVWSLRQRDRLVLSSTSRSPQTLNPDLRSRLQPIGLNRPSGSAISQRETLGDQRADSAADTTLQPSVQPSAKRPYLVTPRRRRRAPST